MHAPIANSQINKPAKLYKRFIATSEAELDGNEVEFENHFYRETARFAWVNADDMQAGSDSMLRGLTLRTDSTNIKFHGKWKARKGDSKEVELGDILELDGEFWIVQEGIQRIRHKSLINFATIYAPIKRIL